MGLPSDLSWDLTPRELLALKAVREQHLEIEARRWAIDRAEFRNFAFRPAVPWTAEEVLGRGDRQARLAEHQMDSMRLMKVQRELGAIHSGSKPEDIEGLPQWARAHGKGPGGGWSPEELARAFGGK